MTERFLHKKSLGQHFLNSAVVPRWMCDAADLTEGDIVVEVGPGTGALTRELLARGARVIALEADQRAIAVLEETFPAEIQRGLLTIVEADMRTFDLADLNLTDQGYAVVANIPYYLSGMLFRTFLEHRSQPHTLVFLVQKEVAKRLTESVQMGGKESLLSLSAQAYGTPTYVRTVGRGHFTPPPKVDSAIVRIEDITRARITHPDLFFTLLHLGFGQKRKQLLGNLSAAYPRSLLTHTFSTVGLPADVRAEDVPLQKWIALTDELRAQK